MMVLAKHYRLPKLLSIGLMIIGYMSLPSFAQDTADELPVVITGEMPLYPLIAQAAHISGIVKVRVTTDGKNVTSLDAESGPAMLVKFVKENIKTWEFLGHKPTTFVTTFEYHIEDTVHCGYSNVTTTLHLPLEVHISANGVMTCDPTTTVTKTIQK
jgi:hypothetical protein